MRNLVEREEFRELFETLGIFDSIIGKSGENDVLTFLSNPDNPVPEFIILDLHMERRDSGLRILRQLRGDTRFNNTFVVVCDDQNDPEVQILAIRAGADAYTVKLKAYSCFDQVAAYIIATYRARKPLKRTEDAENKLVCCAVLNGNICHHVVTETGKAGLSTRFLSCETAAEFSTKIYESRFFVCDITSDNSIIAICLGMAISLGKTILVLADEHVDISDIKSLAESCQFATYDILSLNGTLVPALKKFFEECTK